MEEKKRLICPHCSRPFRRREAAVSREDNKILICATCGTAEALGGFILYLERIKEVK